MNTRSRTAIISAFNGESKTLAAAMRKAGYSESYCRNPQLLQKTKAWQEHQQQYDLDSLVECPPSRSRTYDHSLKRRLLYQLSYGRLRILYNINTLVNLRNTV